jgi:peroxiredoxin
MTCCHGWAAREPRSTCAGIVAAARGSRTLPPPVMTIRRHRPSCLVFSTVLLSALALRAEADVQAAPSPAWTLPDAAGRPVSSDQFKGKVVMHDCWATGCPPCRAEIPRDVDLQEKYGREGLVIIGVSLDRGGPEVAQRFIGEHKLNDQVVLGDDQIIEAFGGVEAIPATFIIDRAGVVRFR